MSSFCHVRDRADAKYVLLHPEEFSPSNALEAVKPLGRATLRTLARARFALPPVMASVHGRHHRRRRVALARFLTTEKVAAVEPIATKLVRAQVDTARDELARTGACDLATTTAGFPPTQLMLHMMEWECDDLDRLVAASDDALELFWGWPSEDRQVQLAESSVWLFSWLRDNVLGKDNLLARAMAPTDVTDAELMSLAFFLGIAGHRTTSYLAWNALELVLQTPGAWVAADDHPSGLRGWASEWTKAALAHTSSVTTWRRRALTEATLPSGLAVPEGAHVVIHLSGNHDATPGDTGIPAHDDYQLAFGIGLHRCLGAVLAEMEVRVILEETRRFFPALTLTDKNAERIELLSFTAPRHVNVTQTIHHNTTRK